MLVMPNLLDDVNMPIPKVPYTGQWSNPLTSLVICDFLCVGSTFGAGHAHKLLFRLYPLFLHTHPSLFDNQQKKPVEYKISIGKSLTGKSKSRSPTRVFSTSFLSHNPAYPAQNGCHYQPSVSVHQADPDA